MGLKFRRGTNAQKSGSLAFGEPYVNTDLGTLQIGGLTGDITLGASGTGSAGTFSGISGSSLDITGNAKIDGNLTLGGTITIGDNSSDNVVVNADLSSSIIPNNDNSFDLGSTSFRYRAIHGTNIYGAINATNGVISGSSQVIDILSSLNSFSASENTKSSTLALYTASVDTKFSTLQTLTASMAAQVSRLQESTASLNAFSASENTKSETLRLYTASVDTKFSTLQTYTASIDTKFSTLQTLTASTTTQISRIQESTASLNLYTSSNDTTNTTQNTRLSRLEESTASLNAFSASQLVKDSTLQTYTTSVDAKFSTLATYTGSNDTTNTTQNTRLTRLEEATSSLNSLTGSYARTNTANVFSGNQTITGSLYITQDLVVGGSSSIQNISSSRLDIGDNIIQLNVNQPALRFGGLAIFDSGSAGGSGSFLYDAVEDEFIFVHRGNGTNVTSSHFITGPETYDNLGNETYLTINRLPKSSGKEHILDSNITDTGTLITLGSNTVVGGTLVASGTSLVSSSAQVNYTQLSGISANIISASTDSSNVDFIISGGSITANLFGGVVSGSSQVVGILTSLNEFSASENTKSATLATFTSSLATTYEGRASAAKTIFSGSSQVVGSAITTNTITIGSTSTALGGTSTTLAGLTSVSSTGFTGALTGNASTATTLQNARTINGTSFDGSANITIANLVSGSSQIDATATTNFATGVKTQLNSNTVVSGSSQIVGSSITTNTVTIGSTAIALGGTATTIAGLTSVSSTGFTGALTGNASTATTLATARTINGTSFNGSADITIPNLVSGSSQITAGSTTNFATDVKTQLNSNTVVSGSSQIAIASVSGYDANRWVDHTAVSISAGNGLSGGGTIAATRTLSLDTTSATFTTGVTTQNNALAVVSGSRTISGIALGSNLATLTIGTGLSGTSYNGSTGVTIANTGVLSVTTNTGLSSNVSATGNVTITNTGVTSNVAGTGVSVSGATGAVTISIGQAVATSSNVQFNSLGIGMAASATAGRIDATNDIVAYSSSDIRFKENITPIENALEKISKISGNTYDWKAENKIEHGYEGNDVGVIAQEIEAVLPQLVQTRESGYKAVKYDKLVALLIEGIKEQQTQIHSLTIEIEKLKESKGL